MQDLRIKRWLFSALLVLSVGRAMACESPLELALVGTWQYYKFLYQGQEHRPLDPNLVMTYEFTASGESVLKWIKDGGNVVCERRGQYTYSQCHLEDIVTWVNPDNSLECGLDPDMKMGRVTRNPADVIGNELYWYLTLAGEPLTYVWKKMEK